MAEVLVATDYNHTSCKRVRQIPVDGRTDQAECSGTLCSLYCKVLGTTNPTSQTPSLMRHKRFTPNALLHPAVMWTSGMALWALQTKTIPEYYERTQQLGWYPSNADTILIPIVGGYVASVIFAPVVALLLWIALRKSVRQHRHWLVWHNRRWVLCSFITAGCGTFAFLAVESLPFELTNALPYNAAAGIQWSVYWLGMRSVIVSKLYAGSELEPTSAREAIGSVCILGSITEPTAALPRTPAPR